MGVDFNKTPRYLGCGASYWDGRSQGAQQPHPTNTRDLTDVPSGGRRRVMMPEYLSGAVYVLGNVQRNIIMHLQSEVQNF